MSVCKPVYPTTASIPGSIVDFTQFNDPLSRFDRDQLRTVSALNNVLLQELLKTSSLTQYPSLQTVANTRQITDTEFASILIDSGLSLDFVQFTFVNNFPIAIPEEDETAIIEALVNDGYTREEVVNSPNAENIDILLSIEDQYYNANEFNNSLCSSFIDPFKKILAAVQSLSDLVNGIQGLASNITKLINDIQKYGSLSAIVSQLMSTLTDFQNQLVDLIEKEKEQLLKKVKGIEDTAKRLFNEISDLPKAPLDFINKKISQAKNFFSEENMTKIKDDVKAFFNKAINQFEDVIPDVLNFFLLKACGLANMLSSIMKKPVDRLSSLVSSYTDMHNIASGMSSNTRSRVKVSGGQRIDPKERSNSTQTGLANYNGATPDDPVFLSTITEKERDLLDQIGETGLKGYFNFSGSNVPIMGQKALAWFEANKTDSEHQKYWNADENFHKDLGSEGGIVDAGFAKVKIEVWVSLIRAIDATKAAGYSVPDLTINSAYRSPYYNWYLRTNGISKTAVHSRHTRGEALDIKVYAIDPTAREVFIANMSAAGFNGIGVYSSFVHFDIRNSNARWSDGTSIPRSVDPTPLPNQLPTELLRSQTEFSQLDAFNDPTSTILLRT